MGYQRLRKRRETEGQKVREGGRMQCFMRKEDKRLIDVENVETTGKRCCHLSWRTQLNGSLCMFFGMKYSSPIFMYIVPMYSRLTKLTKTLPQMSFLFRSGAHPWLCWQLERSQVPSCTRQLETCARLMQGWVASARCPPNKNPGYAGVFSPAMVGRYAHESVC